MLYKIILFVACLVSAVESFSQNPTIQWSHVYGGSMADSSLYSCESSLGDIYLSGTGYSSNNNFTGNQGGSDVWLSKVSKSGVLSWQKVIGGTAHDGVVSIAPTTDGGVVLLCFSSSSSGDFLFGSGMYLLKYDLNGANVFTTYLGGGTSTIGKVIATSDGGFLIGSCFESTVSIAIDGSLVTLTSNGSKDAWFIKLNGDGQVTWHKNIGGSNDETIYSLVESGGAFYGVGSTSSSTVNSQSNNGLEDMLAVRLSSTGSTQWTQLIGGSATDYATDITASQAGVLWVIGTSNSSNGDFPINIGGSDIWFFNVSQATGTVTNANAPFGTSAEDESASIIYDERENIPVFSGSTFGQLNTGDPAGQNVFFARALALGGVGVKLAYGGSGHDTANQLLQLSDGGLLITATTNSTNGDVGQNLGLTDLWALKLQTCTQELSINSITIDQNFERRAQNKIESNSQVQGSGTRVLYGAPSVEMNPGFSVEAGSVFTAVVEGCN